MRSSRPRGTDAAVLLAAVLALAGPTGAAPEASPRVEILQPVGKLPARLVEPIESPRAFVETSTGLALVLDGGTHAVYAIDTARGTSRRIIQIGSESGRILSPSGFSLGPNDILAIADAPGGSTRVQYFGDDGRLINGFYLAAQPGVRVALGRLALRGAGALAFTGRTFILNTPATGALMSEFDATGEAVRSIGALRTTGQESDRALHASLNTGIPLVDPMGGLYFVFETGTPMFRRYDAGGVLVFERHIEGMELDAALANMPTTWPARSQADVWPVAPSLVQTAAIDRTGRLWVSLTGGYTYVFDRRGDKIRTVRFQAGDSTIAPISLSFAGGNRILVTPGCYEFNAD